jgi:hypothetical protein
MATGCTLGADSNLKNASDIEFFNSETDSHPIRCHKTDIEPEKNDTTGVCSYFCLNPIHDRVFSFQKSQLKIFCQQNYVQCSRSTNLQPTASLSSVTSWNSSVGGSPEKVNPISCYQVKDRVMVNEVDEYFELP